jgi:acyl-coenzyme A synthetase/AMP-(fatty) acid ligase
VNYAIPDMLAREAGTAVALQHGDVCWSLTDLRSEADRCGEWIETIAPPRAGIMLVPSNSPESVAFILGAMQSDRVPLVADPAWTTYELAVLMRKCGVCAAAWQDGAVRDLTGRMSEWGVFQAAVQNGLPRLHTDVSIAFGRFTSGTTGTARCLGFSRNALVAAAHSWGMAAGYKPTDRVLCLATLNNGLAFNAAVFPALLAGARVVFHPGRLLPRSLERTIRVVQPTVLVAFPFVYGQLTESHAAHADLTCLRLAISSAARLEPSVKTAWLERSGAMLCDYYGLVEVGPCTFNDGSDPTSVGRALPGVTIDVTDEQGRVIKSGVQGRIRVKTASMAHEFIDNDQPRLVADIDAEGRYVTRDEGYIDDDGQLHLTGRVGRQINIEGRKIEPAEVEAVLTAIPGVRIAVVVAEAGGRRPELAAYIEATGVSRADIVACCVEHLAAYKVPQRIEIVPRLPRSSSGKVSVGRLRSFTGHRADQVDK